MTPSDSQTDPVGVESCARWTGRKRGFAGGTGLAGRAHPVALPRVRIILRGDSGFCREPIMAWCDANNNTYYLLGPGPE